jgi:hypothetical protein
LGSAKPTLRVPDFQYQERFVYENVVAFRAHAFCGQDTQIGRHYRSGERQLFTAFCAR